jgi:hypothetical protein
MKNYLERESLNNVYYIMSDKIITKVIKVKKRTNVNDCNFDLLNKILLKMDTIEESNSKLLDSNQHLNKKINGLEELNEELLDKIYCLEKKLNNVNDYQDNCNIDDKFYIIEDKLDNISKSINLIKTGKVYINDFKMKELNENIYIDIYNSIDENIIISKLKFNDERSILQILGKFYKSSNDKDIENNKINYPIKIRGKLDFEYFNNGKWIEDKYGDIVIDLILNNFNKLFKKVNLYPTNIKDSDIFMRNQHFIDSLTMNNNCSRSSYNNLRKKLKRKLRDELRRNGN